MATLHEHQKVSTSTIPSKKEYTRKCPGCGEQIKYSWQLSMELAEKAGTLCDKCIAKDFLPHEPKAGNPRRILRTRTCPKCHGVIKYTTYTGYKWAEQRNTNCIKCSTRKTAKERGARLKMFHKKNRSK